MIEVKSHSGRLHCSPGAERMESARFNAYLAASKRAGLRYSREHQAQMGDVKRLGALIKNLDIAGFKVTISEDLREQYNAETRAIAHANNEAGSRLDAIETELATRGLKLYPFQRDGVRFLMSRDRAGLFDEMGLGKTPQTLAALPKGARVVVIAPAAVKGVWTREAAIWRPDFKVSILKGRNSFRWPRKNEIVVLNWDILPSCNEVKVGRHKRYVLDLGEAPKGVIVVADEAHAVKNRKAIRTKRFSALSRTVRFNSGKVWLLTGTPLLNRPNELWQVLAAADLARDAFGHWNRFVGFFGGTPGKFGGFEWGGPDKIDPEVPNMLRTVSLMRRRIEVLPDLPTKTYRSIEVNGISAELRALCDALVARLLGEGIDLEGAIEEVEITKLQSIGFREMSRVRAALATAKIPATVQMVQEFEEQDEPVIVFSAHRPVIDTLGARKGWAKIVGGMPHEKRNEIVEQFQAGKLRGVALTIQAGGMGLTLTHAAHALFVDLGWTPALNQQAEDRICRIGQTRGCIITRLVASHVLDARVIELLHSKQMLISKAVEASARTEVTTDDCIAPLPEVNAAEQDGSHFDIEDSEMPRQSAKPNVKREPLSPVERWAIEGLIRVADMDPDRASAINAVGFARFDSTFGHSLTKQYTRTSKLSEKQWAAVVKLATKYRKQIGEAPDPMEDLFNEAN